MPVQYLLRGLKKTVLSAYSQMDVKPLKNLEHVGSKYHGYHIPSNYLTKQSVCYCIGAGDDISFDTELKIKFDADVVMFDPTPASKDHFDKLRNALRLNQPPPKVHGDPSFNYRISADKLEEMTFVQEGVWTEKTILKFHDPDVEGYVSQSVFLFKDSKKVMELPVDRLSSLMKKLGHQQVDLVKLEIEGAEYTVIDTILEDRLNVKMILVEFDEIYHVKGFSHFKRIRSTCAKLKKAGYILAHSTPKLKRTFIREDVFNELKAREKNVAGKLTLASTNN
jgi:FkbM family methyltransferase